MPAVEAEGQGRINAVQRHASQLGAEVGAQVAVGGHNLRHTGGDA